MDEWLYIRGELALGEFLGDDRFVAIINGDAVEDSYTLFEEISKKMNFPEYFGHNWNALQDCLCDMSWTQNKNNYSIVWNNASNIINNNPSDFLEFIDVFRAAKDYWFTLNVKFDLVIVDKLIYTVSRFINDNSGEH